LPVAVAVFAVVASMSLEPNPNYMAADDFMTMPERLWFVRDNAGWLRHLLDFSQTRFTGVGDFSLFRPSCTFNGGSKTWPAGTIASSFTSSPS
jgi:hypothetical protein